MVELAATTVVVVRLAARLQAGRVAQAWGHRGHRYDDGHGAPTCPSLGHLVGKKRKTNEGRKIRKEMTRGAHAPLCLRHRACAARHWDSIAHCSMMCLALRPIAGCLIEGWRRWRGRKGRWGEEGLVAMFTPCWLLTVHAMSDVTTQGRSMDLR